MKKLILIAVAGVFVLSSCTKSWTCECTKANGSTTSEEIKAPKKNAKATCEAMSNGSGMSCKLK